MMNAWEIQVVKLAENIVGVKVDLKQAIGVEHLKPIAVEAAIKVKDMIAEAIKNGQHIDIVIISGRMPIWLACSLCHDLYHLVPAVAVFDPKLQDAVIVASHHQKYEDGKTVKAYHDIDLSPLL